MEKQTNTVVYKPNIHPTAFIAKGSVVMGNVSLAEDSSIWYNATVRSGEDPIIIGKGSNIQDNAVLHVDRDYKVVIGEYSTIGHSAIIHGCIIGNNTLVGMGAIILNGAIIGNNCIIGAGALVTQGTVIPDNSLVVGCPGKVIRQVSEEDAKMNIHNAIHYVEEAKLYKKMEEET